MDREIRMRYAGQWRSLDVACPRPFEDIDAVEERFHREHERAYAYSDEDQPVEIYGLRVTGRGLVEKPEFPDIGDGDVAAARTDTREAYFTDVGEYVETDIYDRTLLGEGDTFEGPAVVEQMDSTIVVPPGASAEVDEIGNVIITV